MLEPKDSSAVSVPCDKARPLLPRLLGGLFLLFGLWAPLTVSGAESPFHLAGDVYQTLRYEHGNPDALRPFFEAPLRRSLNEELIANPTITWTGPGSLYALGDFDLSYQGQWEAPGGFHSEGADAKVNKLYADWAWQSRLYLRVGKQRLKWGAGWMFNPSNPVNPPQSPFTTIREREGVKAASAEWITSKLAALLFAVPDEHELEDTGVGLKVSSGAIPNTEVSASYYWFERSEKHLGFNLSNSPLYSYPYLDTLQWWVEAGLYTKPKLPPLPGRSEPEEEFHQSLLFGMTFEVPVARTKCIAEYYKISEGLSAGELASVIEGTRSPNPEIAGPASAWVPVLSSQSGRIGRHYLSLIITQPATSGVNAILDNVDLTTTALVNLSDGSWFVNHEVTTTYVPHLELTLLFDWTRGGSTDEFGALPFDYFAGIRAKVSF